jgi:hypothetical protein
MPYDKNNPHKEDSKEFWHLIDAVCMHLYSGSLFHQRAANQVRKIGIRGIARWQENASCCDLLERQCLEKLLTDRLDYQPNIDLSGTQKAMTYTLKGPQDFKGMFDEWIHREEEYIEDILPAMKMAVDYDICVYDKLCKLLENVQDEVFRVRLLKKRLESAGWNAMDIMEVSRIIHDHFDKHTSSSDLNINLG